jgi:Holliday junction resolvase
LAHHTPWRDGDDPGERTRFEGELQRLLEQRGFACVKSAQSRSPVDLVAFNCSQVRLIQVKSVQHFDSPHNLAVFRKAISGLHSVPTAPHCSKELWVRELKGGWRFLVCTDAPRESVTLREYLRTADWQEFS